MRCSLLIVLVYTAVCRVAPGADSVSGTWVYVERWDKMEGDRRPDFYTSPAIVLRFCPDGRFTMLKCMLYRHAQQYTSIGSDDGLEIYRGTWSTARGGASVSYHLADAQITFTGYDAAKKRQIKASASLQGDALHMPVVRLFPPPEKDFATTFQPKEKLPAPLHERFVDCGKRGDKT